MSQKSSYIMSQRLSFLMPHKRSILISQRVKFLLSQKLSLNIQYVACSEFQNTWHIIATIEKLFIHSNHVGHTDRFNTAQYPLHLEIKLIELINYINSDQQEPARTQKYFFEFIRNPLRNTEFCLLSVAQKSISD